MTAFDLIGALRTYASSLGWHFLYGDSFMRNFEATKNTYASGDLILMSDPFTATPVYSTNGNKLISISYSGLLALGRKRETLTESNLDETWLQKYDNRLLTLLGTLSSNLITFSCAQELTLQAVNLAMNVNQLDENIDFVTGTLTFLQEL